MLAPLARPSSGMLAVAIEDSYRVRWSSGTWSMPSLFLLLKFPLGMAEASRLGRLAVGRCSGGLGSSAESCCQCSFQSADSYITMIQKKASMEWGQGHIEPLSS